MPVRFRCPCGQKLKVAESAVGKCAKCPKCSRRLRVPNGATYETVAEEAPRKSHETGGAKNPRPPTGIAAGAEQAPEPEREAPEEEAKGRILVADSVPSDRDQLVVMLRNHGYSVIEAGDGEKAISLIRDRHPGAVVLDVSLDLMSGFQVIQHVRNLSNPLNKEVWNVPMLMTTAKLRGRDKQYAMSLGVGGYFAKPVQPAKFFPRLEKALEQPR